ncbi:helix-turn-helix domain-containing protein [Cellulosimicrobium funkei]|uniref:helix-turn-helix domain-containing protein n=1 Tax=Cellulosimicrobium funkei TaxID=264251 RepID=UPI0037DC6646
MADTFDKTPMLDVDDVAAKCKVSRDTVRKWRAVGVAPRWYRLGKHLRCGAADFSAWLEGCAVGDGPTRQVPDDNGGWD